MVKFRAEDQGSNSSKPYQAQLIARHGFKVPEMLVTNQPDLVRQFVAQHGQVVYQSASGYRSIVKNFGDDDLARLDDIRWCPVQFQAAQHRPTDRLGGGSVPRRRDR